MGAIERARQGQSALVVVEGAAGMGKTRLLEEGAEVARRLGVRSGLGTVEQADAVAELAPLLRALFDGAEPLVDAGELNRLYAAPEHRYWRLQALRSVLDRAASTGPMLVVLDDVQWADSGTVAALRSLPLRLADRPAAWVLALRPDQAARRLDGLIDDLIRDGAERLVLEPLSADATAQVAKDVMQAEPDQGLLKMIEDAGGSPFLLVELLIGLRQERLVRVESGQANLVEARLPDRVRASMQARLQRLPAPAGEVAAAAASLGRGFSFSDLASMLGFVPATLLSPVEQLIDAGILMERNDRLYFTHDLVREAVRHASGRSARQALDRHAAAVMLERGALPVDVALQLVDSATPGDEIAISTLARAAEALAATDPGASADLSQRALELMHRNHPLIGPLVARTATSLHAAGRVQEAKAFADNALHEVLPAAQEGEVRLGIAGMWSVAADVRADAGREALKLESLPVSLRVAHKARLAYNLIVGGRVAEARVALAEAKADTPVAEHRVQFPLTITEAGLDYYEGRFGDALDRSGLILRGGGDGHELDELLVRLWRADVLLALGRADESLQAVDAMIAESRRRGLAFFRVVAETWRGQLLLQTGRLEEARATLRGRFDVPIGSIVTVLDAAGVAALGRVAMHTADTHLIRRTSELARAMIAESTPGVRRHAAWMLALQAMADEDPAQAHRWVCVMGQPERLELLPRLWAEVGDEPHLVRIALANADGELAASVAAAARYRATQNPRAKPMLGIAAHVTGLLENDPKQLERAVELLSAGPHLLALGAALEDLALFRATQGEHEMEITALSQALSLFVSVGAGHDAGRLRNRLRTLGVRPRAQVTGRPSKGWASLTPSELAVARLVASGLTNRDVAARLFISHHTVNTHLRQVFAKLEISSRVDLARLDLGPGTPSTDRALSVTMQPD